MSQPTRMIGTCLWCRRTLYVWEGKVTGHANLCLNRVQTRTIKDGTDTCTRSY